MNLKKPKITTLFITVFVYASLAFLGLSLLKHFGIRYDGTKIHIYAIPMMLVISIYVYLINGNPLLKKEEFYPKKEYLWLHLLPYFTCLTVFTTIIEAIVTQRSVIDLIFMAILTFLIGFSEEGMFRYFILKHCGSSFKKKVFLFLFSTISFSMLHMMNIGGGLSFQDALSQSINAIPFGLVAGFLFLRTRNISGLIFWHMFIDYHLFVSQLGIFISATILGIIVDIVMMIAFIRGIIQMISDYKQKRQTTSVK